MELEESGCLGLAFLAVGSEFKESIRRSGAIRTLLVLVKRGIDKIHL